MRGRSVTEHAAYTCTPTPLTRTRTANMRNLLQDKLLKAGLVKKNKVDQVVREQSRQRQGKTVAPAAAEEAQLDVQQLQAQRAERDRQLAAQQQEQQRRNELRSQILQIIESNKLPRQGEIPYRFTDGTAIRSVLVDATQRTRLAAGSVVIARVDSDHYELLPREAAARIHSRDPQVIVLDHGRTQPQEEPSADPDADHYARFVVPDDLVW